MSEWKETVLDDISEITAGYAFKGADFSDNGDEIVIKIKDIQEPFVDTKGATKVFFKNYSYEKLKKYKGSSRFRVGNIPPPTAQEDLKTLDNSGLTGAKNLSRFGHGKNTAPNVIT